MKTKTINLYSFDELSDKAKEKAICDHIEFEISEIGARKDDEECNPYWQYAKEMERMQTPWFLGQVIYQKAKDQIIETIKANGYLFFEDGKLIPVSWYPEN
jgi:hypothetical protein